MHTQAQAQATSTHIHAQTYAQIRRRDRERAQLSVWKKIKLFFILSAILLLLITLEGCGGPGKNLFTVQPNSAANSDPAQANLHGPAKAYVHNPTVAIVGDQTVNAWLTPQVLAANPTWINDGSPSGVVQETSTEILARLPLAIAQKPDIVVLLVGVWDMAPEDSAGGYLTCTEDTPSAPGFPGYEAPADQVVCANIEQMVQLARDAGIYVIVGTLPPWGVGSLEEEIGSNPLRVGNIATFDAWLETEWSGVYDVKVADFHAALSQPGIPGVDGGVGQVYILADTTDGVDPNTVAGEQAMTQVVLPVIWQSNVGAAR